MSKQNRIEYLYQKYIDRTCSDAELEELFELLKENQHLASVRAVLRQNWDIQDHPEELVSLDWETFLRRTGQKETPAIRPKRAKKRSRIVPLSIAAGFLVVLGVAAWFWMHREIIAVYESGYGEVKEVVLNDDSRVQLNANSRLYWDSNWKRRGDRNVRIEGEAYFNVAHHDGNRFFVKTPDLTVMVTGTAFNVTRRRDETEVFLESGAVSLELNNTMEKEEVNSNNSSSTKQSLKMVPGEKLRYSSTKGTLEKKDNLTVEQAASWKTGELIYKNVPFHEVLQELSDVYGKSFEVQDTALFDKKIDVGMPYKDWETVKGVMQYMINVKITEAGNKVVIKKE